MIEVPLTSLVMLGFCSFLLGVFAADILLKLFARVLNWRITYENGCKKCGHEAGVYVAMDAACIHCIFIESDRRMAEYVAEQKIIEEGLKVELKRIADEAAVERAEKDKKFAAEKAERDRIYAEQTERTKKGWEEADERIKRGGDEC